MNIHTIAAGSAAAPARKSRRPKSVRPRFKGMYDAHTPERGTQIIPTLGGDQTASTPAIAMPPAVGGTMDMLGRDDDAILAAIYASEGHPLAMLVRLRHEAAIHVEALLAFLDATEGDLDLADDSEPTLEAIREAVRLCDSDQEDSEPSLGSFDRILNQSVAWKTSDWIAQQEDRELDDCDDEDGGDDEPLADDEPSLCGITAEFGGENGFGNDTDRELECRPDPKRLQIQRSRHNRNSICNVRPIPGAEWRVL